ncbi:unnamed protein product [marine sediment metagenome]|uniref:Uncharacterized protein n=1 Tax=marine sediment metagenome TaxID=412755 RepID=X1EBG8_9ZZZZ
MALEFPVDCITAAERTEYCYRAQELLRKLHNVFGRWFKEGITQIVWDKLPQKLKNKYPYVSQLSQDQWTDFQINIFEPKSNKIVEKLLLHRQDLKDSRRWNIKIEDV